MQHEKLSDKTKHGIYLSVSFILLFSFFVFTFATEENFVVFCFSAIQIMWNNTVSSEIV